MIASELWEALNLSTMMRNTANDITQYLAMIGTDNPYFHRPLDIFKVLSPFYFFIYIPLLG
jgi:hypothetical protein